MDEFFNSWLNHTAEQKEVYASAVGLSKFELESRYWQWYCCKLIEDRYAVPTSVQCDVFKDSYSNKSVVNNNQLEAIITLRKIAAVYDWVVQSRMNSEPEEIELRLHNYDFDTIYVKKILAAFDTLRGSYAISNKQKKCTQSTFAMLHQYFFPTQTVTGTISM